MPGQTPTGLAHMAGNVAEYIAEYEDNVPGYDHYSCPRYIVKGGSALTTADKLKIRERGYIHNCYFEDASTQEQREMMRFEVTGFRCVFDH